MEYNSLIQKDKHAIAATCWSLKGLREEKYVRRKKDKYQMVSPEEYRQTLTADQRNKAPRRKGQGMETGRGRGQRNMTEEGSMMVGELDHT